MKQILIISLLICILLLAGCGEARSIGIIGGADGPTAIYVDKNDKWGVYLYADDVNPTGMTLKIEQSGGSPSGSLEYGAAYTLETLVNNEWQEVKTKTGEPLVWNALGYMVKMNDITEININWEYGYGKLNPGEYRLCKEIMDFRATGDFDKNLYYAYFTIE